MKHVPEEVIGLVRRLRLDFCRRCELLFKASVRLISMKMDLLVIQLKRD